jgi:hypothetical protein
VLQITKIMQNDFKSALYAQIFAILLAYRQGKLVLMLKKKEETLEKIQRNKDNLSIALRKNLQRRKTVKNIKDKKESKLDE